VGDEEVGEIDGCFRTLRARISFETHRVPRNFLIFFRLPFFVSWMFVQKYRHHSKDVAVLLSIE
jgi:hypothetical protein